ncbi:MAG: Cupin 2 conserved barrel domain protein [Mucilaginibacter sp.]|nr:Cupin 2 conserved barrel domain protein [Mucilaginibacter sp.]
MEVYNSNKTIKIKTMNRKHFLMGLSAMVGGLSALGKNRESSTETFNFKDDGKIPNSKYPLIIYHNAFTERGPEGAAWLENKFAQNNWSNSWRNGVYLFHHYHSISHEVLGIFNGSALLHLGGEQGKKIKVQAGDIIVIPAGVGHKNLGDENDFGVVGAYPGGHSWDLLKGLPGERPQADKNISAVQFPSTDPLFGKNDGLIKIWRS